ncbi:sugar phosphate isomerase/epimerase [Candidatus Sumerlaeota bacterium]|nr:sugar phosphate isomerase/epimerase [Candidatus Sumerlaeota bacterium]
MFLGISMWSFHKEAFAGKMSFQDFILYASNEGYQGVELLDCFWKEKEDEIQKAKDIAGESGLQIGCYSIGNDFALPEADKRAEQAKYVQRGIETASLLGAPIMRVFGGSPKQDVTYQKALPWIVDGFRACKELAEEKGVVMAMENHGTLSGSWKQVKQIIESVDSPNFGATADFGNFLLVDETPLDCVKGILPWIKHVHCKDFVPTPNGETQYYEALSKKRFSGCNLGAGVVGIGPLLELLKKNRYEAMISLEYEGLLPSSQGVPQSKAFLQRYF